MRLFKMIKAYFGGKIVVVVKGNDNRYSYFKGGKIDNRFILNSFTEIIKMNI